MGRVWLGNRSVFLFGIVNCSGIVGLELNGLKCWNFLRILGLKDGIFRLIRVCCALDSPFLFFYFFLEIVGNRGRFLVQFFR